MKGSSDEMNGRVYIYDTTLRDGSQTEGISFSCEDKLDIYNKMCSFGMDFVEGGWPGSNPRDDEFFSKAPIRDGTALTAFGSTRRYGVKPDEDPNLRALAASRAEWCCIFGKTWDFQVTDALCIGLEDNLRMVEDSVRFLKESGKRVMFDAEHFFDGFRSNRHYALKALQAAEKGGAEWLVLCDTNGGSTPEQVTEAVRIVSESVDAPLGIHCHNDSDLATACTLAAVSAGCRLVQGTVNGLGERCGNANLCTVIPNLSIKMGMDVGRINMRHLTPLSKYIGEVANMTPSAGMAYVGDRAFTHKGGIHVSALMRNPRTYEHVPPESVGNTRRVLVSDMAGKASITEKLKQLGMMDEGDSRDIVDKIKEMESRGYQFEGADASFELMVRKLRGEFHPRFTVEEFRVFMDEYGTSEGRSEASVKVRDIHGEMEHTAADGNGPVNALDNALRKALRRFFPEMDSLRLTDYKVRVIDEKSATMTAVRVLIRTTDGKDNWTTVGVSTNVIEASMIALLDSIEYSLDKNSRKE